MDYTGGCFLFAEQDAQQGCFTHPVYTNQTDTRIAGNTQVDPAENIIGSKSLGKIGGGNQRHGIISQADGFISGKGYLNWITHLRSQSIFGASVNHTNI